MLAVSPVRNKTGKDKGDPLQKFPVVVFLICEFTIIRVCCFSLGSSPEKSKILSALHAMPLVDNALTQSGSSRYVGRHDASFD